MYVYLVSCRFILVSAKVYLIMEVEIATAVALKKNVFGYIYDEVQQEAAAETTKTKQ